MTARKKFADDVIQHIELLDTELADLRVIFLEILKNYQSRIEQDMQRIRDALDDMKNSDSDAGALRDLKSILSTLRALETKPERGRRKDLKKIEDAICEVLNIVEGLR
jgi:hypothetical protein